MIALEYILEELNKMPHDRQLYVLDLRILLTQAIAVQKEYDAYNGDDRDDKC